ncbi:sterol desaturase family protein [Uliginosibacterium gangwonense]|uniref:sterol desaturase family protein n=1 Tax=Uliginosibacterium gangwonense TaxID=392736 RepID=UPI000380DE07|nr:sterol desaturase family protein [Uliginosibacterium gangwonense]
MRLFSLEHSRFAYGIDFMAYGVAVVGLTSLLVVLSPPTQRLALIALVLVGLLSWSLIEYLLHRFVLHGMQPFRRWHAAHHQRPKALIYTPTIMSAAMIFFLVFMPTFGVMGLWSASSFFLGVLVGYFAYSVTHHAIHHWQFNSLWLKQRKHWHALHHRRLDKPGYYGVTNSFWDRVFGSGESERSPGSARG